MKISFNWIQEMVTLPKGVTATDMAERLTQAGLEVEGIERLGEGLREVIVGRVERLAKHPNADQLSLCVVQTGTERLNVVCGANNVREGILVPLARQGVTLPNGMTIKKSKIRGEVSEGMICSEAELGLVETSSGIMILDDPDLSLGASLAEAFKLEDEVLDVAVTPNRPDCLGHLGIAREVAALFHLSFAGPAFKKVVEKGRADLSVKIESPSACCGYLGRRISGLKVVSSPLAVQARLKALGFRPINQIVDATNYVLMEVGHPTHAFDARAVHGASLTIRFARQGEGMMLLDGKSCVLRPQQDLLICDERGPLALAGVMGGQDSQIQPDTQEILLECAAFDPRVIRNTSRSLGIHSESSLRFERGVDPWSLEMAMDRLSALIEQWSRQTAPALQISPVVLQREEWPPAKEVSISTAFINRRLGTDLSAATAVGYLQDLGLQKVREKGEEMLFTVPSYRRDLERPIDLVEEVARLHGYEAIPVTLPKPRLRRVRELPVQAWQARAREALVAAGFREAIHYSFVSPEDLRVFGVDPAAMLFIKNPLAPDQAVMRSLLWPGLLRAMAYNLNRDLSEVRLFECGKVFARAREGGELSHERLSLAGVMTGHREEVHWNRPQVPLDFFDLKGVLEIVCHRLQGVELALHPLAEAKGPLSFLHPGESAVVRVKMGSEVREVGLCGAFHPQILSHFEITQPVWGFEIDVEALLPGWERAREGYRPPSPYPAVRRDLAVVLAKETPAQSIYELIFSLKNKIIESVQLFDVYEGEQIPAGKKSMAFRMEYLSRERTLTQEEVERVHQRVLKVLETGVGAEIRST